VSVPAKRKKPRVPDNIFDGILRRLANGEALRPMCDNDKSLPSWRTVLRYVQEDEAAYKRYRQSRVLQSEYYRDEIIKLSEMPLPADPKLAMAEVQRRRLEIDTKDKYIRQLAPSGVRDRAEDAGGPQGGTLVIQWGQRAESPAIVDVTNVIDVEAEELDDG
jgi:hypothetical protein